MIARLLAMLLMLPSLALAEPRLPALYDVSGVGADDVLNIRATGSATAPIIGSRAPDAKDIEVVALSDSGAWARVNVAEASGYVALRFLQRQNRADWTALQSGLRCSGTEPFWGLSIDPKGHSGSLSSPEARTRMMQIDRVWPGQGAQPVAALSMQGMSAGGTAVLRPALCSDGMSDRSYGIAIDLFMADDRSNQTTTYSGCCSLAP